MKARIIDDRKRARIALIRTRLRSLAVVDYTELSRYPNRSLYCFTDPNRPIFLLFPYRKEQGILQQ